MRWSYIEVTSDGELEHITVEVLDERRIVMGVETIVVHDVVTDADGEVIEDTYDWFAQDDDGNVWYFGEDTTAYNDGVASHEGAWEAGVDGALPGIVMPGDPTGHAERLPPGVPRRRGRGHGPGDRGRQLRSTYRPARSTTSSAHATGHRSNRTSSRRRRTRPGSAGSTRRRRMRTASSRSQC